ncbi:hypothetical protein HA466_0176610 [Hirschfeldia incana]|nr:hypothetical protein HA466_0176610 [Hirschfeldia incana]
MPKILATEPSRITLNPALLALTPRQVLISRPVMAKESKSSSLKSEQKALVLRSIAQYLDRCGFSKCFKKLLSEAEIEKKELDSELPDLEEVYGVFLNKSNLEAVDVKDESGQKKEAVEGVEKVKKEKKKKNKAEVTKEEKVKETDAEIEDGVKETKKKKKEPKVEEKVKETDAEIQDGVKEKKKKKKNKSKSTEAEEEAKEQTKNDEEKVSKKRKRSEPETEAKEETEDNEESKRRKKEEKVAEDVQETPVKQTDGQENGDVETKSTNKKSGKGLSESKEPKKPFQRVNVEEVVFTDDRLKDNSYWAKGGADLGYGAKAQEVLGQVRGRGFRHEKTKKKRGSYRGGEIDLQSHSVKFEYSDDE